MFDPTAVQAAPAPQRAPNLFALLAGIWFLPGRTLRAVAVGAAWLWVIPFLIALALRAAPLDPLRALKYE
jgi:hypothetical protein